MPAGDTPAGNVVVVGPVRTFGHEIVLEIAPTLDADGKFGVRLLVDGAQHYVGRYDPGQLADVRLV